MRRLLYSLLAILMSQTVVIGNRDLTTTEIEVILEDLCSRGGNGWIEQGKIEAIHNSFDAETGNSTESRETVTTDGNHFSWDIELVSVMNSGQPAAMSDDMKWNQRRRFTWDGQSYTLYFKSGKHVIRQENPDMPVRVTGPLTAGFIPWGTGFFTSDQLTAAQTSAVEAITEEGTRVELTVAAENHPEMRFILNPEKDYAVESYTRFQSESIKVVQTYGNYILKAGRYIPMNILIDTFDTHRLLSSDSWEIISIHDTVPADITFSADIEEMTLVEHYTPLLETPSYYRHSKNKNIGPLLEERFSAGLKKGLLKQNCGSVAASHLLTEYGSDASDAELISLVDDASGDTSLYQIRQLLQDKGLHCVAVKTNIKTLRTLNNCRALIHLPEKKHFVVLDRIDSKHVWLIDLDRQTFYHTLAINEFKQQWAGITLLVSNQPLSPGREDVPIQDPMLKRIKGSADYSCTKLIQEYRVIQCPSPVRGTCGGRYEMYYSRYGCEQTDDSGFCSGTGVVGSVYSECIEDPFNPGLCTVTGSWTSRYMRACQP